MYNIAVWNVPIAVLRMVNPHNTRRNVYIFGLRVATWTVGPRG